MLYACCLLQKALVEFLHRHFARLLFGGISGWLIHWKRLEGGGGKGKGGLVYALVRERIEVSEANVTLTVLCLLQLSFPRAISVLSFCILFVYVFAVCFSRFNCCYLQDQHTLTCCCGTELTARQTQASNLGPAVHSVHGAGAYRCDSWLKGGHACLWLGEPWLLLLLMLLDLDDGVWKGCWIDMLLDWNAARWTCCWIVMMLDW